MKSASWILGAVVALTVSHNAAALQAQEAALVKGTKPPSYPPAARAAGHQGMIAVRVLVGVDGKAKSVELKQSSRSKELDDHFLEWARNQKYTPPRDASGAPVEGPYDFTYGFVKDSIAAGPDDVSKKTCADFAADVRWFKETRPEAKLSDMRLYPLMLGVRVLSAPGGISGSAPFIARFKPAFEKTADICAREPKKLFLEVLQREW